MTIAWVDPSAITANTAALAALAPNAVVCAVVKADGYGHGAVTAARAALAGGATWLAVARVEEAAVLRGAGIDSRILLLSESVDDADAGDASMDRALALGLDLVVYRPDFVDAVAARAEALGVPEVRMHLKVDTGMRRVGCLPRDAVGIARRVLEAPRLALTGTCTHLAMADQPDDPTTPSQLAAFDAVLTAMESAGLDPGLRHVANSAGTIAWPGAHLDLVRVGIAIYGIDPDPALAGRIELRPALRWTAPVTMVKEVSAGDRVSYGHRHIFDADTTVATIAVGYADGFRRRLGLAGGEVLVGGRRRPVVGVVTMDQAIVDLGPGEATVRPGDEAVLIGAQGDQTITAADMAARLDTIGYEIVCGISPRVRRVTPC